MKATKAVSDDLQDEIAKLEAKTGAITMALDESRPQPELIHHLEGAL